MGRDQGSYWVVALLVVSLAGCTALGRKGHSGKTYAMTSQEIDKYESRKAGLLARAATPGNTDQERAICRLHEAAVAGVRDTESVGIEIGQTHLPRASARTLLELDEIAACGPYETSLRNEEKRLSSMASTMLSELGLDPQSQKADPVGLAEQPRHVGPQRTRGEETPKLISRAEHEAARARRLRLEASVRKKSAIVASLRARLEAVEAERSQMERERERVQALKQQELERERRAIEQAKADARAEAERQKERDRLAAECESIKWRGTLEYRLAKARPKDGELEDQVWSIASKPRSEELTQCAVNEFEARRCEGPDGPGRGTLLFTAVTAGLGEYDFRRKRFPVEVPIGGGLLADDMIRFSGTKTRYIEIPDIGEAEQLRLGPPPMLILAIRIKKAAFARVPDSQLIQLWRSRLEQGTRRMTKSERRLAREMGRALESQREWRIDFEVVGFQARDARSGDWLAGTPEPVPSRPGLLEHCARTSVVKPDIRAAAGLNGAFRRIAVRSGEAATNGW